GRGGGRWGVAAGGAAGADGGRDRRHGRGGQGPPGPGDDRGGHGRAADGRQPRPGHRGDPGPHRGQGGGDLGRGGGRAGLPGGAGAGAARGSWVVFATGGGSSQFTFGRGPEVDERFSLPVGAVRHTERFGLAGVVHPSALGDARAAIAAALAT